MSTNNILHPANGSPIIVPSQDIVLGLYYLSIEREGEPGEYKCFTDDEVKKFYGPDAAKYKGAKIPKQGVYKNLAALEHALNAGAVTLHAKIKYYGFRKADGSPYDTTPGRVMPGSVLPKNPKIPFDIVNKLMTKREISAMIDQVHRHCGQKETVIFCDRIMALGFHNAFKAGISFGKDDMVVPASKWKIIDRTKEQAKEFEQQYNDGLITQGEKYNKV